VRGAVCAVSLFGALACVREHTLFEDEASQGGVSGTNDMAGASGGGSVGMLAAGSGAAGDTRPPKVLPWVKETCLAALSAGTMGDPCSGAFTCSATADCCQVNVICKGDMLTVQNACDKCVVPCSVDSDCSTRKLCEASQCVDCPVGPCPPNSKMVVRNACPVCVPPA
jgi:hypothetical protein